MKHTSKKFKLMALATAAFISLPVAAYATTQAVTSTASFFRTILLSATNLAFSKIDYNALPSVAGDNVQLGTNGTIAYNGTFTAHTGAAPTAGSVTVTQGTTGSLVDISCATTGKLADGTGASTIGINQVQISTAAGAGAYNAVGNCAGIGTNSITAYSLAGSDVFKVGGQITGAVLTGAFLGGVYSTANTNGVALSVQVLYE